jgi:ATP-dependent DNA helicase RecG
MLEDNLSIIRGVGDELEKKFKLLGINTISDLIYNFPRRYEDYSVIQKIGEIRPGPVTIKGEIKQATGRYVARGLHITEAIVTDETGSTRLVWFNQPYRANSIRHNQEYFVSGNFELSNRRLGITSPSIELASEFPANTARILPVYRLTKGLTSNTIRKIMKQLINEIRNLPENLPLEIVKRQNLISHAEAIELIHFPRKTSDISIAQNRLGFEEVFELSLASLMNKQENDLNDSFKVAFREELAKKFVTHLPFTLTDAQRRVVWQIYKDLSNSQPMNRMVEGDVGSGKTVVATMASLMVMAEGYQIAFMAPTEILARQHAETISSLLKPLGYLDSLGLLVGSMTNKEKQFIKDELKSGKIKFIIGTHALIEENVVMDRLALVVIDEQQRFGVKQRKKLMSKASRLPHFLSLTATPIPRSLALTIFGELDVSVLDEKPKNRKPIITSLVSPNSKAPTIEAIRAELDAGRQMFVICPLIAESAVLDVSSVEKIFKELSTKDFKKYKLGMLHGKMKGDEKNSIMQDFIDHKVDILVSTTVIEVGVDVPNASIMMIEAADRFGLAQLHQLRGRVGRGDDQGYCYLMLSDSKAASPRLRALISSNDGFKLAELDLKLRGPGAIYGNMQHGELDLRMAKLDDLSLITRARKCAEEFISKNQDISKYKELNHKVSKLRVITNLN